MSESQSKNGDNNGKFKCKICNNDSGNELIIAHERQLGLGDQFEYILCSECKCLQIKEIPGNMDRYYPSDYYSFMEPVFPTKLNRFNFFLKKSLINYYMGNTDITGFFLSSVFDHPFPWLRKREIDFNSKILDIGSGAGRKLLSMQRSGFKNITGLDPFIAEDIIYPGNLKIFKKEISDIDDKFDFITLHHSFEHMPDPLMAIKQISRLLKPEGTALIRVPVSDSYAWHTYREFWVGLDAPRHLFLHTPKSINHLLNDTDLKIDEITYESGAFQFTGSEKYKRNLTLDTPDTIFSRKELKKFHAKAKELNRNSMGDSACFYLKKTGKN